MNNSGKKRLLALLLALCLLVISMPAAFAVAPETPADSVTVYFTLSCDGSPIVGNDVNHTVLSKLKITVPYFDLADYGLQNYYRYETEGGFGPYVNNKLVERPTVLHLLLYALERFYEGRPAINCGKGLLNKDAAIVAFNMAGDRVSRDSTTGAPIPPGEALRCSGAATSFFMNGFWGHDCNLMYFVDHQYPLMSPGWGATADYILLEDGMDIDMAMFTDWGFYHTGGFTYFGQDEYTIALDEMASIDVWKTDTGASVEGEYAIGVPAKGMDLEVWTQDMSECLLKLGTTDEYGTVEYEFTNNEEAYNHIVP